ASKFRAFDRVPGKRARLVVVHFFFLSLPRMQQILARRYVFELERTVAADRRFGVAEQVIGRGGLGRDQGSAKPLRQLRALTIWNDTATQACRALGDYHFDSRNFFARLEREAGARNVNRLWYRGLRDRADMPIFIGQIRFDPVTACLQTFHS